MLDLLAYNINGEVFEVPAAATGWRVRRMKPRGAPEVVYGRDGVPLIVPIDSDLDELRRNVDAPGRFRLDAVDERGRTIEDVPAAYVMVASKLDDEPATAAAAPVVAPADDAVREAMRLNTELARSVIDRFPEVMHAAAELLRAADGAGLPARQPRAIEVFEEEDEEGGEAPPPSPGLDLLNTLVAQIVPLVMSSIAGKGLPKLDAVLDWRRAAPSTANVEPEPEQAAKPGKAEKASRPEKNPKPAAAQMAHIAAIQAALTPAEAGRAQQIAAQLSPAELGAWFDDLAKLSLPDAVAKIRSVIGTTGGAS